MGGGGMNSLSGGECMRPLTREQAIDEAVRYVCGGHLYPQGILTAVRRGASTYELGRNYFVTLGLIRDAFRNVCIDKVVI